MQVDGSADFKSVLYSNLKGKQFAVTRGNKLVLLSGKDCLGGLTMAGKFAELKWSCAGSQAFNPDSAHSCTNSCIVPTSLTACLLVCKCSNEYLTANGIAHSLPAPVFSRVALVVVN